MRIIGCGDVHLGLKSAGYDCFDDTLRAFRAVVAKTHHADLFVLWGDLFHRPAPEPRESAAAIETLLQVGCPAVIFPGNHDVGKGGVHRVVGGKSIPAPDALEPLRRIPWSRETLIPDSPIIATVDGKRFLFACHLSDARARQISDGEHGAQGVIDELFEEAATEGVDAVFSHLDVHGATTGTEGAFLVGGSLQIPIKVTARMQCPIVNGHIHKRQRVGRIEIPGSLVPTDFGDRDGDKGYATLEV
jgi:DNA repair exonuclease SbcCD nuclease subunit